MTEVTQLLLKIEDGDPSAAEKLLPVVDDEPRKLAAARLAFEKPGQTLQATAFVHDACLRLVDEEKARQWDSAQDIFSAAAAEAMRLILIENARRKQSKKRGGTLNRVDLTLLQPDEDARHGGTDRAR